MPPSETYVALCVTLDVVLGCAIWHLRGKIEGRGRQRLTPYAGAPESSSVSRRKDIETQMGRVVVTLGPTAAAVGGPEATNHNRFRRLLVGMGVSNLGVAAEDSRD